LTNGLGHLIDGRQTFAAVIWESRLATFDCLD
jgi:hypothetical protein